MLLLYGGSSTVESVGVWLDVLEDSAARATGGGDMLSHSWSLQPQPDDAIPLAPPPLNKHIALVHGGALDGKEQFAVTPPPLKFMSSKKLHCAA